MQAQSTHRFQPPPSPPALVSGREIRRIIIHCSASPDGKRVTVAEIDRWHAQRGFKRDPRLIGYNSPELKSIGYHYVIYANGPVTIGRGEREVGAHCQGFNTYSLGICLVGTDAFRREQWASLKGLVTELRKCHPKADVVGHRDMSPDQNKNGVVEPFEWLKTCPGFSVAAWLAGGMQPMKGHIFEPAPLPPENVA